MRFIIFAAFLGLCAAYSTPTCTQINAMASTINASLVSNISYLPSMIRLAFHDCVGGCNGCINLDNSDNSGLSDIITMLDTLRSSNSYDSVVSKADFYALAAATAVTYGVKNSNTLRGSKICTVPCFDLYWGRTDSSDCSSDYTTLPSPTYDGDTMFTYFSDEFGFSRDQVVALMGAHTVGKAFLTNSGYKGVWTLGEQYQFDERFYSNFYQSDFTWTNLDVSVTSAKKYQYKGFNSSGATIGIMLNTDVEIFYNLTLDSNAKATCTLDATCGLDSSCSSSECSKATTFDLAYSYGQSCDTWLTDFQSVFNLMVQNGYSSLTEADCCS